MCILFSTKKKIELKIKIIKKKANMTIPTMTLLNTWITFNKFNKNILTAVCFLSSSRPICRCVNGAGLPSKEKKCDVNLRQS